MQVRALDKAQVVEQDQAREPVQEQALARVQEREPVLEQALEREPVLAREQALAQAQEQEQGRVLERERVQAQVPDLAAAIPGRRSLSRASCTVEANPSPDRWSICMSRARPVMDPARCPCPMDR